MYEKVYLFYHTSKPAIIKINYLSRKKWNKLMHILFGNILDLIPKNTSKSKIERVVYLYELIKKENLKHFRDELLIKYLTLVKYENLNKEVEWWVINLLKSLNGKNRKSAKRIIDFKNDCFSEVNQKEKEILREAEILNNILNGEENLLDIDEITIQHEVPIDVWVNVEEVETKFHKYEGSSYAGYMTPEEGNVTKIEILNEKIEKLKKKLEVRIPTFINVEKEITLTEEIPFKYDPKDYQEMVKNIMFNVDPNLPKRIERLKNYRETVKREFEIKNIDEELAKLEDIAKIQETAEKKKKEAQEFLNKINQKVKVDRKIKIIEKVPNPIAFEHEVKRMKYAEKLKLDFV